MKIVINQNNNPYDVANPLNTGQTERAGAPERMVQTDAENIRYVKSGDSFSGQVISRGDDGAVKLLLGDKSTLNAQLSRDMPLSIGQTLSFQVVSTANSKISLIPLYANLSGDSAIGKALNQAGLPVTQENAEMVSAMMERGLPIDSGSLQAMAYTSSRFPMADPKSIVQMSEIGLPLTEENIQEFEIYKNNQHAIADSVDSLAEGLSELAAKHPSLNKEITGLFFGETSPQLGAALSEAVINGNTAQLAEALGVESGLFEEALPSEALEGAIAEGTSGGGGENAAVQGESAEIAGNKDAVLINKEAADASDGIKLQKDAVQPEKADAAGIKDSAQRDITGHVTDNMHALLGKGGSRELANSLKLMGLPDKVAERVADGSLDTKQALALTRVALKEAFSGSQGEMAKAAARGLLQSEPYKLLLKNEITDQFLLKPEDVADKEKVRQYSEKISGESKGNTPLAQGMKSLSNNLDFMNQLNQVMTYIQLPLKMNEAAAKGDLYVYTNKKNLKNNDGNVSALLHLDMEHLGTMDIHVKMDANLHVQTHFMLQEESMLDFIADHLNELDEALSKRGYSVSSDVSLNDEKKSVPDIMFNQGADQRLIQTTSFDIRA